MHHPTERIAHTTAFVTPVVEHWLEREIAQWVHPMKDRSDDPLHHERTLYLWAMSRSSAYIPLCELFFHYCTMSKRSYHGGTSHSYNSSMGPPHEGSIRRPIAPWSNALTTELHLAPHQDQTLLPQSYISLHTKTEHSYHGATSRSTPRPNTPTTELHLAPHQDRTLLPRSYISLAQNPEKRIVRPYLDSVLSSQLLRVESRAADRVVGEFAGGHEQRGRLGKQLVVVRLHPDRLHQHRVAGVLVRMQLWKLVFVCVIPVTLTQDWLEGEIAKILRIHIENFKIIICLCYTCDINSALVGTRNS